VTFAKYSSGPLVRAQKSYACILVTRDVYNVKARISEDQPVI
jgi:hypothetical protein